MSTTASPAPPQKINLRRPDIMSAVQAQVESHYRSTLVERIRASGNVLSAPGLTIKLAKEFGFCYGVERAIDLAYAARRSFPAEKPIYLLGEIIHNPEVNDQIRAMGIRTISNKPNDTELAMLQREDVVIIPAFGTEVATRRKLEEKGCLLVDTTCGDVMSVWKRVRQYANDGVTSIIHGKADHEETRATSSRARDTQGNGHFVVVYDLREADMVCDYIRRKGDRAAFLEKFAKACSDGFDPDFHLGKVGVANQTTMLRSETEEVQRRVREAVVVRDGNADNFRVFDTICGATQERQDALLELLSNPPDLMLVVGGYNSSNTTHLADMAAEKTPTYFVGNAACLDSVETIRHFDMHAKHEIATANWMPSGPVSLGITAGASCPGNLIEDVLRRFLELRGIPLKESAAS
jgi:4-hydroxy-3-methylbut-2-enyl diphosphate reductase